MAEETPVKAVQVKLVLLGECDESVLQQCYSAHQGRLARMSLPHIADEACPFTPYYSLRPICLHTDHFKSPIDHLD